MKNVHHFAHLGGLGCVEVEVLRQGGQDLALLLLQRPIGAHDFGGHRVGGVALALIEHGGGILHQAAGTPIAQGVQQGIHQADHLGVAALAKGGAVTEGMAQGAGASHRQHAIPGNSGKGDRREGGGSVHRCRGRGSGRGRRGGRRVHGAGHGEKDGEERGSGPQRWFPPLPVLPIVSCPKRNNHCQGRRPEHRY